MVRRSLSPVLLLSLLLLAVFSVAGIAVRGYVSDAFAASRAIENSRALASGALKLQLDEETGIRGFAATQDPIFLEPYHDANRAFGTSLANLRVALSGNHTNAGAVAYVDDAVRTNRQWSQDVANPLLLDPKSPNAAGLQRRGKQFVDRFRHDILAIDGLLQARDDAVGQEARRAIDRIDLLVVSGAIVLIALVFFYALQQMRVASREERLQQIAEVDRREKAEFRAAYEAEKRIADTLQIAFTQRVLPKLESLQFSASYVAATEDTKVGGDWYDAMALTENRVLFAIGDVTGHGIEAAVTMNAARQSLIASALLDADPGAILARVNADLSTQETRLVTAVAGVADARTYEFSYAIAGHPPPILMEPGRPPRMLECGSLPLGAMQDTHYAVRRVQSVPGGILVLYTDGAVEHSRNVVEGEKILLAAIAEARDRAQSDAASYIHEAIFAGRAVGDDVAILTIGFMAGAVKGLALSADRTNSPIQTRVEIIPKAANVSSSMLRKTA